MGTYHQQWRVNAFVYFSLAWNMIGGVQTAQAETLTELLLNKRAKQTEAKEIISTDILFIVFDPGDTFALMPVMTTLRANGYSYRVLPLGMSTTLIRENDTLVDLLKHCGAPAKLQKPILRGDQAIDADDLERIDACLKPKTIVTGASSEAQRQIAERLTTFETNGSSNMSKGERKVYVYYDNFSLLSKDRFARKFLEDKWEWLVPSVATAEEVKKLRPRVHTTVVGQPSLERWRFRAATEHLNANRTLLPVPNAKMPTLLYAGGYDEGYESAFYVFAGAAKDLSDYNVVISLHPKVDGSLERNLLAQSGNQNAMILSKRISTVDAALNADIVVTQRSSVGVQAMFMGKPVIYVDSPRSDYHDVGLDHQLARRVTDDEGFKKALQAKKAAPSPETLHKMLGIPQYAASKIAEILAKASSIPSTL